LRNHIAGLSQHLAEGRQKLAVLDRAQRAARAQSCLDLGQHVVVGKVAVERDVDLVHRRRQVAEHALHQRTPNPRVGVHRARGRADRVEQIVDAERVVDAFAT